MKISLYFLLAVCFLLAVGSAIFSAVLVTQDHNSQLNQLQRDTAASQIAGFRAFITIATNFMASETETSVRRLKFMRASRNASFLTDPANFAADLNNSLVLEWMPQAPSLGEAFWSFTALYPVSAYPDWNIALAAQHMAETRRDGTRSQFTCMPEDKGVNNISYCHQVTWDNVVGNPTIHNPYTYTFNSDDGLGNTSGINWFTPMYVWVSQDGWAYWYITHQTLVVVNGVQVVVQTMDSVERLAANLQLIKDNGAEFIILDQYENVISTTIREAADKEIACCTASKSDCTECITSPASSHEVKTIKDVTAALFDPSNKDLSNPCAGTRILDFTLNGQTYVGASSCGFDKDELRLIIIWFQPKSSTGSVSIGLVITVAVLVIAPTLILCVACIIAILIPIDNMSQLMHALAYDFVESEPEITSIPLLSSVFVEIQAMSSSFMTLGETILTVVKYVPRDLVRKDVATLLGIQDESEELVQAMQELEDEGELDVYEDMESSRIAPSHLSPVGPKASSDAGSVSSSNISNLGPVASSRRPSRFATLSNQTSFMANSMAHTQSRNQGSFRKVAVVFVNLSGFHISNRVVEQLPKVVSSIEQCAKKSKGVLDSFHGDHFMVTFNAMTTCALYMRGAVSFYCDLREMLDGLRVEFTAGIAAGEATVGIIGSDTTRKFSVVSSVVTDAAMLERSCVHLIPHARCLAYNTIASEAAYVAHFHYCRPLLFSYSAEKSHVLSIYRKTSPSAVDEWMYELEDNVKKDPFHAVNALAKSFLSGEDPLAKIKARTKLDQMPHSLDKDSVEIVALKELLEL